MIVERSLENRKILNYSLRKSKIWNEICKKLLISYEDFEEIEGVRLDEIKYGITSKDKESSTDEDLRKLRRSLNFESALRKAQRYTTYKKRSSFILNVLFYSVIPSLFCQFILWIIDFIFKNSLLAYHFAMIDIPIYYLAIPLGVWMGIGINKKSIAASKENRVIKAERLEALVKSKENHYQKLLTGVMQ